MKQGGRTLSRQTLQAMRLIAYERMREGESPAGYAKRTGVARSPLRAGEQLAERVHEQPSQMQKNPALIRSFFQHPSVAYLSDCWVMTARMEMDGKRLEPRLPAW